MNSPSPGVWGRILLNRSSLIRRWSTSSASVLRPWARAWLLSSKPTLVAISSRKALRRWLVGRNPKTKKPATRQTVTIVSVHWARTHKAVWLWMLFMASAPAPIEAQGKRNFELAHHVIVLALLAGIRHAHLLEERHRRELVQEDGQVHVGRADTLHADLEAAIDGGFARTLGLLNRGG